MDSRLIIQKVVFKYKKHLIFEMGQIMISSETHWLRVEKKYDWENEIVKTFRDKGSERSIVNTGDEYLVLPTIVAEC